MKSSLLPWLVVLEACLLSDSLLQYLIHLKSLSKHNVKNLNPFCLPASFMLTARAVPMVEVFSFTGNSSSSVTDLSRRAVVLAAKQPHSHGLELMVTSRLSPHH